MKDLTGPDSAEARVDAGVAAVPHLECGQRKALAARRWAREAMRRGIFELLYLGSNVAIAGAGLLWLYQMLTHRPAFNAGLDLMVAVALSLCAYHLARWRASASMSRQVERLTAWLIATLGIALGWGGICFAFTFAVLRWLSAPEAASWIIGATMGLCGFAQIVAGERRELHDCLALPAAAIQDRPSGESAA